MTRDQAIEIARRCAKAKPQSYYSEPFQPHEWVIDAIIETAAHWEGIYQSAVNGRREFRQALRDERGSEGKPESEVTK